MTFDETLAGVLELLQREGRVSYRALRRRFNLDEEYLEDLKAEIIQAKKLAVDEDGTVLVWAGETAVVPPSAPAMAHEQGPLAYTPRHLAEKILTSRTALAGERKQVTVLFCDLANSTALAERVGPETMHTLFNRFFALALNEVHRYEGTINQFLGDGFMALFGAPVAHEDHARRAVLAAVALQRTLREHPAELGQPHDVACQFRMGLNTGLVVVGSIGDNLRMDYTAVGDTTNLAARLQQVAEPDTILISESTRRLVQGSMRLEALAPVEVKGKIAPVVVYKVLGVGLAQHALARVAQAEGALAEAKRYLDEAQQTYTAIQGRYWIGRTHLDLAILAHAQGHRDTATMHANSAQALFMALHIPRYVERTQQFASACGLVLSNAW